MAYLFISFADRLDRDISTKNEIGCLTTNEEKMFDCCKHDHIVFICLDSEKGDPFIEKRRNLARKR